MKRLLEKNLIKQIIKFGFVGGIAFVIDYALLIICKEIFHLSIPLSVAVAFTISVIFNYILSIKWIFKVDKSKSKKRNFILFVLLSIVGLVITELIMKIGTENLKINYIIVKVIATGIVMVFNFVTRKLFLENNCRINFNSKYILLLISFISYLTLCFDKIITTYNILSLIMFIFITVIFMKYFKWTNKKEILILSIIISISLVLGNLCSQNLYEKDISIIKELFSLVNIIKIIGYFFIIHVLFNIFFPVISKINIKKNIPNHNKKIVFVVSFVILVLSYIIYFLSMYPATLSSDSLGEMNRAITGLVSDHHPVAHVLMIKMCYKISYPIFHNYTSVVATYSIFQITIMSIIFSYTILYIYSITNKLKIAAGMLLFYALIPIFGYYSIVVWKDVLFGTFLLLLTIECFKLSQKDNISLLQSIAFIIVSLLTIFFRNNAIYMYYILIIVLLIVYKKHLKKLLMIFSIVLIVFYTIKGPVFNYYSIKKSASAEYLAIPIQQISRVVYKKKSLSKEQTEKINKVIDVNMLRKLYNPKIVDPIKFHKDFNIKEFNKDKIGYFKLWGEIAIKYPLTIIESHLISTLGYWYPNLEDRGYECTIHEPNRFKLKTMPHSPKFIQKLIAKIGKSDTPLVGLTWSIGLWFWVLLILLNEMIRRKKYKELCAFVPIIGIWFTLIIATPVWNETRYIFSLFTTIPFLSVITFLNKEKS